jgi:predicted outer membrane lipoprotein
MNYVKLVNIIGRVVAAQFACIDAWVLQHMHVVRAHMYG